MKPETAERIGEFGGAAITFYSGYMMTQFEEHPKVALDESLAPLIRIAGYSLMGYAAYNLIRSYLISIRT